MSVGPSNLQASMRAAAVSLLSAYATSTGTKLQIYPGRPKSLVPPTAFVDRMTESMEWMRAGWPQRTVRAEVVIVHGLFDSAEAAAQKDDFADGFVYWIADNGFEAAGNNTVTDIPSIDDEPAWTPDWRPANATNGPNPTYYATRLVLEGFAGG